MEFEWILIATGWLDCVFYHKGAYRKGVIFWSPAMILPPASDSSSMPRRQPSLWNTTLLWPRANGLGKLSGAQNATHFWFPGSKGILESPSKMSRPFKKSIKFTHVVDVLAAPWFVFNLFRWCFFHGYIHRKPCRCMDDEVMRQTFPLFVKTTATTTWFSALASSSRSFFVNHHTLLMLYLGTDVCI